MSTTTSPSEKSAPSFDDCSNSFTKIRSHLVDSHGVRYVDFVRTLKPIYWRIYLDIALRYAAWIGTVIATCWAQSSGISPFVLVLPASFVIALAAPAAHIHEAAHWNIAPNRKINDLLCNILMSWIIALEIKFYRKVHFDHHRHLGTAKDTERSYFFPLNVSFMLKGLTGVSAAQTLIGYGKSVDAGDKTSNGPDPIALVVFAAGAFIHGSIVIGLWFFGYSAASVAWLLGIGALVPFVGSIRQILEHRMDDASSDVDYSKVDQGACTRVFGDGPLARVLGASGFNRHLLHHWEPQVSYTRLPDLERFLNETSMRTILDRRRTTYAQTFLQLFSAG